MRGLLGRGGLESGEGLLLRPAGSVHMFFMRFPIDVVFLSRDGEVLKIVSDLRPWRTAGARRAKSALVSTCPFWRGPARGRPRTTHRLQRNGGLRAGGIRGCDKSVKVALGAR